MSIVSERLKQSKFDSLAHEAVLSLLVTVNYLKEKHHSVGEEKGISYQHFNILRILKGVHPKGHPRCEISARMVERAPDITRLIDKLVKEGLVKRTKSAEDMRQSVAIITEKGMDFLEELNIEIQEIDDRFSSAVGNDDLKRIISICEKILKME